jgi:hypothetical protein
MLNLPSKNERRSPFFNLLPATKAAEQLKVFAFGDCRGSAWVERCYRSDHNHDGQGGDALPRQLLLVRHSFHPPKGRYATRYNIGSERTNVACDFDPR